MINLDFAKIGGMRFLKVGRLTFCWSVSSEFRPIGGSLRGAYKEQRRQRRERAIFERGMKAGDQMARASFARQLRAQR